MKASDAIDPRVAGATAVLGGVIMLAGAATWASTGADLDQALTQGSIAQYLESAKANASALCVNLTLWIVGVILMGAGGCQLALLGRTRIAAAAVACFGYTVGVGAAIVFFPLWLGIVLGLAPAHAAGSDVLAVAVALGQAATIADWIATVLILAVGSVCVAKAGADIWVPRWLLVWSRLVGIAGLSSLLGVVLGDRSTYAMLVVPLGVGWLIAAGITAARWKPAAEK